MHVDLVLEKPTLYQQSLDRDCAAASGCYCCLLWVTSSLSFCIYICLYLSLCLCPSKLCSCLLVSDVALSGSSPLSVSNATDCWVLKDVMWKGLTTRSCSYWHNLSKDGGETDRPSLRVTRLLVSDRTTKTFLADLSQPHLMMNRGHSTKIHRPACICEQSTPQVQFLSQLPKSKIQQQFSAPEIQIIMKSKGTQKEILCLIKLVIEAPGSIALSWNVKV